MQYVICLTVDIYLSLCDTYKFGDTHILMI